METIIGSNNYAVQIDDGNNVNNVIFVPIGSAVTSNHDALNAKKMQAMDSNAVLKEVVNPVYSLKFEALPELGLPCIANQFYQYGDKVVQCLQTHNRTEHAIEDIPNLFLFSRVDDGTLEWMKNERIPLDAFRTYLGIKYKCIQANVAYAGQTPNLTPALWNVVSTTSEWTIGVAYKVNDEVTYLGKTYKCLQPNTAIASWNPVLTLNVLWILVTIPNKTASLLKTGYNATINGIKNIYDKTLKAFKIT